MIKLFRTKKQEPISNTKSIEEQIHNDVYSAQELILQEAKRILSNPPTFTKQKEEKLKKLESLGFRNFDEAKKLREERDEQKKHSEFNAAINYYRKVYPLHRFISVDSVKIISKKYDLLLADARDYIAEIPEKNQQEIINFKVMRKDIRFPHEVFSRFQSFSIATSQLDWIQSDIERQRAENSGDTIGYYKERKKEKKEFNRQKTAGTDLLIVAPQHKLDMREKVVKDGVLINEDPIVLQPVQYGYLIVSSWGLEAGDPLVVNAINN